MLSEESFQVLPTFFYTFLFAFFALLVQCFFFNKSHCIDFDSNDFKTIIFYGRYTYISLAITLFQQYWLDIEKPMCRQVGLSMLEPTLRFCVKFYTSDPARLEEEFTRYLFCLQVKKDLATGCIQCNENTAALMASYIVQGREFVPPLLLLINVSFFLYMEQGKRADGTSDG